MVLARRHDFRAPARRRQSCNDLFREMLPVGMPWCLIRRYRLIAFEKTNSDPSNNLRLGRRADTPPLTQVNDVP